MTHTTTITDTDGQLRESEPTFNDAETPRLFVLFAELMDGDDGCELGEDGEEELTDMWDDYE